METIVPILYPNIQFSPDSYGAIRFIPTRGSNSTAFSCAEAAVAMPKARTAIIIFFISFTLLLCVI